MGKYPEYHRIRRIRQRPFSLFKALTRGAVLSCVVKKNFFFLFHLLFLSKASYILVKYLQVEWMNRFLKYLLTQNSYLTDRSVIFQSIFSMNKRWYIFITLRWVSSPLYAPCLIWRKYVVFGHPPIRNFLHPGLGSGEGSNALTRAYHLIR